MPEIDWNQALNRLLTPATGLVLIGAALGFGGQRLGNTLFHGRERAGLILRLVGVAMVMAGLLWMTR